MSEEGKPVGQPAQQIVSIEEHNKLLERARNFEAKLTDYEKRFNGVDPDRYKALNEEVSILRKEAAGGDPKKIEELISKERNELEQALEKRFSTKLTETETLLKNSQGELRRMKVVKPAMMEAAKYFQPDQLSLLEPLIESSLDIEGEDIVVRGKDGKPAPSIKDPRNPKMGLDEFFEGLVSKYPSSAKSTMQPGGKQAGVKMSPTPGKVYDLMQLSRMPDGGKEILKNMDPKEIKNLFLKH